MHYTETFDLMSLQIDIEKWITEFVSVYNEQLGAIPCPFAKSAMMNGRIKYIEADYGYEMVNMCEYLSRTDLSHEVVVVGIDIDKSGITPAGLERIVSECNNYLRQIKSVALEDHPHSTESINGVTMNEGKWALLLIQKSDKLVKARRILKEQGYYTNWSEQQQQEMFKRI